MSRWLDIASRAEGNSNTPPDIQQEPARSPHAGTSSPFLLVSAGCRERKSEESQNGEAMPLSVLMDRFRERTAILEADEDQPHDRATWLAASAVFVLPDERAEWFGADGNLSPRYRQVSLALGGGVVVTFHHNGRVSFHDKKTGGQTDG